MPEMISRWYDILDTAESKAEDEHKRFVRISRLHVQFTEAELTGDPARRKTLLQGFLDDARKLGSVYIEAAEGGPAAFLDNWKRTEGLQ